MPSTRRQKAKVRKSREADSLTDKENMDILLGNPSLNENFSDIDSVSERSNGHVGGRTLGGNSLETEIRNCRENSAPRTALGSNRVTFQNTDSLRDEMNYRICKKWTDC